MSVSDHYDAAAANYHKQYEEETLRDLAQEYPANYFRLKLLLKSFKKNSIKRTIEVGVGEGTPLSTLAKEGIEVSGFDISHVMVKRAKESIAATGQNPDNIIWGDIQDRTSYQPLLSGGLFDGLMAMGVMPHVEDDDLCLRNMKDMVKPNGMVFIEFRNSLFSLFTFNRYTHEFIMDELLSGVSGEVKNTVDGFLRSKLEMSLPIQRDVIDDDPNTVGYDAILSKFHNPLTIIKKFEELGFIDVELLWYHFHPAMPHLSAVNESQYREDAIHLESFSNDWRGMFLCSAFVVQARKPA
jgi:2-polyprenyl-3-methyl-5-hydroxy-6-metoxy-1,4-benzoquinol methylase